MMFVDAIFSKFSVLLFLEKKRRVVSMFIYSKWKIWKRRRRITDEIIIFKRLNVSGFNKCRVFRAINEAILKLLNCACSKKIRKKNHHTYWNNLIHCVSESHDKIPNYGLVVWRVFSTSSSHIRCSRSRIIVVKYAKIKSTLSKSNRTSSHNFPHLNSNIDFLSPNNSYSLLYSSHSFIHSHKSIIFNLNSKYILSKYHLSKKNWCCFRYILSQKRKYRNICKIFFFSFERKFNCVIINLFGLSEFYEKQKKFFKFRCLFSTEHVKVAKRTFGMATPFESSIDDVSSIAVQQRTGKHDIISFDANEIFIYRNYVIKNGKHSIFLSFLSHFPSKPLFQDISKTLFIPRYFQIRWKNAQTVIE